MTPAERLRDWRRRHALLQTAAADILGVRANTLIQWEAGRRKPHPSALRLIEYTDKFGFIEEMPRGLPSGNIEEEWRWTTPRLTKF